MVAAVVNIWSWLFMSYIWPRSTHCSDISWDRPYYAPFAFINFLRVVEKHSKERTSEVCWGVVRCGYGWWRLMKCSTLWLWVARVEWMNGTWIKPGNDARVCVYVCVWGVCMCVCVCVCVNEWCFRPRFGTVRLYWEQPELMRWILWCVMPLLQDRSLEPLTRSPEWYHYIYYGRPGAEW